MTASATAEVREEAADLANLAGKYLTFELGPEVYGIEILDSEIHDNGALMRAYQADEITMEGNRIENNRTR